MHLLGSIVYRLGHILLKDGSRVRFPVESQNKLKKMIETCGLDHARETLATFAVACQLVQAGNL